MPKESSEAHLNAVVVAAGITSYETFMERTVGLVEAEMVRSNVSVETLSARTGIKLRLLKTVLRDRHMTLRMLASICVVLGLEPNFRHHDIDPKHLRT